MDLDPKAPSMKLWQWLLTHGANEDEATELMNGYAHELAERIREDVDLQDHPGEALVECEGCATVRAAALIDPGMSEPGTYVLSTRRPGAVGGPS
ncbi:hypothetical protein [Streptomyces sp. MN6]